MLACFVSELEKHNSTLKAELAKASQDKEDLKTTGSVAKNLAILQNQ